METSVEDPDFVKAGLNRELLPLDFASLGFEPISSIGVNSRGAITHAVRMPSAPFDAFLRRSRLALVGWVRSGLGQPDPSFRARDINEHLAPAIVEGLHRLMDEMARLSRQNAVPITLILVPNREQILGEAGYAAQDEATAIARTTGLDVFDARWVFAAVRAKSQLFLPDWHFTPLGNRLLLAGLLAYLGQTRPLAAPGGAE